LTYRTVGEMTADELLSHLNADPQHQLALFVKMGGDPTDHNYARLSYLTRELRDRGIPVQSSKVKGLWLEEAA